MTCDAFANTLAEFLEREVTDQTRATMESHALGCAECGALLADLRRLRIDAANLPELVPSRDLWQGIASRIDAPVIPIAVRREDRSARIRMAAWRRWIPMSAAAAVLVAITSLTTYYITKRGVPLEVAAVAPSVKPSEPVNRVSGRETQAIAQIAGAIERDSASSTAGVAALGVAQPVSTAPRPRLASNSKPEAQQVYGREIARLRAIVEQRRAQLDPVTISVIERNLRIIDDAIDQCRRALAKDPASRFLIESLNTALENKVELLRTAAMLPSHT
jgi:hypothetical protein